MKVKKALKEIAKAVNGTVEMHQLPDGSGFATMSMPLPKNHWLYSKRDYQEPPEPFRIGEDKLRDEVESRIISAVRYAIKGATDNGKILDFDPDAMTQNIVYGLLGPRADLTKVARKKKSVKK